MSVTAPPTKTILPHAFALNATVKLTGSGEQGLVIGRAEYLYAEHCYLVRYAQAYNRMVEAWWGESALQAAEPAP